MSYTWLIVLLIVILILTSVVGVFLVLVQNKGQSPGLFGGGAQSAFGSREGDVLTRITGWVVGIFMLGSLVAAWTIGRSTAEERNQAQFQSPSSLPAVSTPPPPTVSQPADVQEEVEAPPTDALDEAQPEDEADVPEEAAVDAADAPEAEADPEVEPADDAAPEADANVEEANPTP